MNANRKDMAHFLSLIIADRGRRVNGDRTGRCGRTTYRDLSGGDVWPGRRSCS